jgi:hypothetical protein
MLARGSCTGDAAECRVRATGGAITLHAVLLLHVVWFECIARVRGRCRVVRL